MGSKMLSILVCILCFVSVATAAAPKKAIDVPFGRNYVPTWAFDHIKYFNGGSEIQLHVDNYTADPPIYDEVVKWLYEASVSGHVRAQYQYALCMHRGRGVQQNIQEALSGTCKLLKVAICVQCIIHQCAIHLGRVCRSTCVMLLFMNSKPHYTTGHGSTCSRLPLQLFPCWRPKTYFAQLSYCLLVRT